MEHRLAARAAGYKRNLITAADTCIVSVGALIRPRADIATTISRHPSVCFQPQTKAVGGDRRVACKERHGRLRLVLGPLVRRYFSLNSPAVSLRPGGIRTIVAIFV